MHIRLLTNFRLFNKTERINVNFLNDSVIAGGNCADVLDEAAGRQTERLTAATAPICSCAEKGTDFMSWKHVKPHMSVERKTRKVPASRPASA